MIDFAKYAFNKSHAASYAVLAYQTAYLKTYYPVEFLAALLTSVMGNSTKVAQYIQDCKRMGIKVMQPDINESYGKFTVVNGKIRFGLLAIKNVGSGIIKSIVRCRKNKKFTSFLDFCERIDTKELNKRAIESMIKAGVFDSLGHNRAQLLAAYEKIIESIQQDRRRNIEGQVSLFNTFDDKIPDEIKYDTLPDVKEFPHKYLLAFEKEMLGIYLSGHPLAEYEELINKVATMTSNELKEINDSTEGHIYRDGEKIVIPGIIIKKQDKITKNNNLMSFITIEDLYGPVEVIVFPAIYSKCMEYIKEDSIVTVIGKINLKEDEDPKILADNIVPLDKENVDLIYKLNKPNKRKPKDNRKNHGNKKLYLKIKNLDEVLMKKIRSILSKSRGNTPVYIYIESKNKKLLADKKLWVNLNQNIINNLTEVLGKDSIKIC